MPALKQWLFPSACPPKAGAVYIALLQAARNPFFFESLAVPDTLDGRFELVVLHLSLLQRRLHGIPGADPFARDIAEAFLNDMDRALRELGVLNPGRRIRRMHKGYQGRLQAYHQSMADRERLKAALARNLYGTIPQGDVDLLATVARYVEALAADLSVTPDAVLLAGDYAWPSPESLLAR